MVISRRSIVRSSFASVVVLASASRSTMALQTGTPEAGDEPGTTLFHQELPELPEAGAGEVEVVLAGIGTDESVGAVIHNASGEAVELDDVSGIARDAAGSLFAVSDTSILAPVVLEPGEYGLAFLSFDKDLAPGVTIDFTVKTREIGSSWIGLIDIPISEVSMDGGTIIGIVENTTDQVASALVAVVGVFFDTQGEICGWFRTYLNDEVDPGGIGTFNTRTVQGLASDSWAMAASGWAG